MLNIHMWRRWVLFHLIGDGVHNSITEEEIIKEAGRNYDINLDRALRSLLDDGIIMFLESSRIRRYVVNFEKLSEAEQIMNSEGITGNTVNYQPKDIGSNNVMQPFLREPVGYIYWFDNEEDRQFKNQSVYRIYFKEHDKMTFVGQLLTKTMSNPKIIRMGSLNDSNSYISRLWRAILSITNEKMDGTFILQDIQDRDRMACGNNRQRGKIALAIFKKLGYIQQVEMKGNSTKFKISGKKPYSVTLDEIFNFTR